MLGISDLMLSSISAIASGNFLRPRRAALAITCFLPYIDLSPLVERVEAYYTAEAGASRVSEAPDSQAKNTVPNVLLYAFCQ